MGKIIFYAVSLPEKFQPEIKCSKLTIELLEEDAKQVQGKRRRSGVFIFNYEHIWYLFLMFLLLLWAGKCQLGYYLIKNI